jgi:ankyrin repeat protein
MQVEKLIAEAMTGNLSGLRELVANGTDVNLTNRLGVTPLMVACQWNHLEIVRFLLDKGADIELSGRSCGRNALMYACLSGNARLVELILQRGAWIDATDCTGRTPLMMAATVGHTEIVRLLVKNGAKINLRDNTGKSAQDWASCEGHRDVVEFLRAQDSVGTTPRTEFQRTKAR